MRRDVLLLGGVVLAGVAAWWWQSGRPTATVFDALADGVYRITGIELMKWQEVAARPENARYIELLHAAEAAQGIPRDMLVRLAYQESRFRPEIIDGTLKSSAGALGLMQIVPRWHPDVDPLNTPQAINYAARFLASLHRQFGTWERALQAYNWGGGNLSKYLAGTIQTMPRETANYSGQILADLNQNGSMIA